MDMDNLSQLKRAVGSVHFDLGYYFDGLTGVVLGLIHESNLELNAVGKTNLFPYIEFRFSEPVNQRKMNRFLVDNYGRKGIFKRARYKVKLRSLIEGLYNLEFYDRF